jgi:two-component system response regulator HydG
VSDATILLVDDEAAHLKTLEKLFAREGHGVLCAADGQQALDLLRAHPVDLVITDVMMPEINGVELLQLARTLRPEAEVILMSAFGTVELAVQGMKEGAYDFLTKPIKRAAILKAANKALERQALLSENRALRAELAKVRAGADDDGPHIVGQSVALRSALDLARQVAASDANVLITGESGTGKELFARLIVARSERAQGPLVTVNCAALPESILESELFGYEKGAFTGANQRKIGRFEAADGGTLFLDEIGDLPFPMQAKLLRVLQEGTFERLGSNTPVKVDVRVLAATHRDLEAAMGEGEFREDLYYRLNVIHITAPPLRRRPEDVPLLAEHFLSRYAAKNNRAISGLSAEALDALAAHAWPGNVRELENVIERAVVLDRDGLIGPDDLPSHIASAEPATEPRHILVPLGTPLEEIERMVITATLEMTGGNKKLAAKLLGIAARTIYRKL